jgi:hypothetical protein
VPPAEFIRRFLLHVLPKAFVKIRHYGLHSSSNATTKLEVAREKILRTGNAPSPTPAAPSAKTWRDRLFEITAIDLTVCRRCGKAVIRLPLLMATTAAAALPGPWDTS